MMPPPAIPRRPHADAPDAGHRPLRERARETVAAIDRSRAPAAGGTARELVTIIDDGAIPTSADHVFIGRPTEIDAEDREGAIPTFSADPDQTIPVIVIRNPAAAGDLLVAHAIAGRWVAELGAGKTKVCVFACGNVPVFGVTITIRSGGATGPIVATCVTGTTGCCTFALAGRYTVQVTVNGTLVSSSVRNLAGTVGIALGSNSGLVCCGGYAIPQVMTLTDAEGSTPFVYWPNGPFPVWFGGHPVSRTSATVTTPGNVCVVAAATDGPVKVCYQMVCFGGQNPTFQIQRSWSWVFAQGTLTPIYYQDPTGITAGQPCVTGPPAICGSPLTDTAGFGANPSRLQPWTLTGTPVPAVSNSTIDPVGGSIVISG